MEKCDKREGSPSVGSSSINSRLSILLVPVRVVDELPMQLPCSISIEVLPAIWALERGTSLHLDANILNAPISRLCGIGDFHGLRHRSEMSLGASMILTLIML